MIWSTDTEAHHIPNINNDCYGWKSLIMICHERTKKISPQPNRYISIRWWCRSHIHVTACHISHPPQTISHGICNVNNSLMCYCHIECSSSLNYEQRKWMGVMQSRTKLWNIFWILSSDLGIRKWKPKKNGNILRMKPKTQFRKLMKRSFPWEKKLRREHVNEPFMLLLLQVVELLASFRVIYFCFQLNTHIFLLFSV